jgi:hypothetical protein
MQRRSTGYSVVGQPTPQHVNATGTTQDLRRRLPARRGAASTSLVWLISGLACTPAIIPERGAETASTELAVAESPAHSDAAERAGADPRSAAEEEHGSKARQATAEPLAWLSPHRIGAAVRAHQSEFTACQALADMESRQREGSVTVGWLVEPDGSVNDVKVGPSTFSSSTVNDCVLAVARGVTFPPSPAPTYVSWTVRFRGPSSSGPIAEAAPTSPIQR